MTLKPGKVHLKVNWLTSGPGCLHVCFHVWFLLAKQINNLIKSAFIYIQRVLNWFYFEDFHFYIHSMQVTEFKLNFFAMFSPSETRTSLNDLLWSVLESHEFFNVQIQEVYIGTKYPLRTAIFTKYHISVS